MIGTAILTAQATTRANDILKAAEHENGEELTTLEKINYALPSYIPPILMGIGTITCIFGANAINKKYQASLLSAYTMLDSSYKEYKNKVSELYGKETDKIVEKEIEKDHCPR